MLLCDLVLKDAQYETRPFEGDVAYGEHKRAQVALCEHWAQTWKDDNVSCYSMHPGWADTPAVQASIPEFYERLKGQWRTPAEGADTIAWLGTVAEIPAEWNGAFFQDRRPAKKHLFGAWSRYKASHLYEYVQMCEHLKENLVAENEA